MLKTKNGFSLLELLITVTLLVSITLFVDPFHFFRFTNAIQTNIQFRDAAQQIFTQLDTLIYHATSISDASPHSLTLTHHQTQHHIHIDQHPQSDPPYKLAITENSTPPTLYIGHYITRLNTPDRPGLIFTYRDQFLQPTTITTNIKIIDITLYLHHEDEDLTLSSSFWIGLPHDTIQAQ